MSSLDAVLGRIDQDIDQSVERLFALLRIASVSTDPAYKEQCRTAAEHATGDHTFFVGEGESAEPGTGRRPLVFHGQSYLPL